MGRWESNVRTHERTKGYGVLRLSDRKTLSAIQRTPYPFVRREPDIRTPIAPCPRLASLCHYNAFQKQKRIVCDGRMGRWQGRDGGDGRP